MVACRISFASVAALCFGLLASPGVTQDNPPTAAAAVVASLDAALLDAMKDARGLGPRGRFARLGPAIRGSFDLDDMTRAAAWKHWERLSAEQRRQLADSFACFETAQYADWFDSYAGQSFSVTGTRILADGSAVVGTVMSGGGGPSLSLDYVLRADSAQHWRIVDVRYNGWMSEVERRRSEFAEVLDHGGIAVLLAKLDSGRQAALDHADNVAKPHLLEPIRDLWSIQVPPID